MGKYNRIVFLSRQIASFTVSHRLVLSATALGTPPLDHRDLQGVVHAEAHDHGVHKYRERLPPRQRHESREAHERQDGARDRLGRKGYRNILLGSVAQNQRRSRTDTIENAAK